MDHHSDVYYTVFITLTVLGNNHITIYHVYTRIWLIDKQFLTISYLLFEPMSTKTTELEVMAAWKSVTISAYPQSTMQVGNLNVLATLAHPRL